ncbi:MAG: NAD-dependent epimerase/dehydratase family protein, partial [Mycobacterium sp.]|nr:NAD-dependent epimerase/dehydratase family protein [Mycobacterium sp.]
MGLTVAVTGPTGEIGISSVDALEQSSEVQRIIGMARRPFDASEHGWSKTEYRQGDILDRDAVDALVSDADVVIHLAFIIMGSREESARINLSGTRNVFAATVAADRPRRLVYTSSVAAYGYHADNPVPITEDVPPRGSPEHYYSEQKAACEAALADITLGSPLEVYVLRPCIVAGPKAPALAEAMPWNQLPGPVKRVTQALPLLKPPFPDPGTPLQLVHHDDVAAAIALAATTSAPPGAYNIAADGVLSMSDVAEALGARPF